MSTRKCKAKSFLFGGYVSVVVLAILTGCVATVAQIRENPAQFGKSDITLAGTVQQVFPIPLTRITVFTLEDDTGAIPVLSRRVPRSGQHVSIRCRLVYFSGSTAVEDAREAQDTIVEFLVNNRVMQEKPAQELSKRLLQILQKLVGGTELSFFVIDTAE